MKKVISFDKSFKITVPISLTIIIAGLIGSAVLGFNNGVDFQAGLNSAVQFVPPSMDISYKGDGTMSLQKVSKTDVTFIARTPSGDSKSYTFAFDQYPTLNALADAIKTVPGLSLNLRADGTTAFAPPSRHLADRCPADGKAVDATLFG